MQEYDNLFKLIRNVKDFPCEGIVFRDITPLLGDNRGLSAAVEAMAKPFRDSQIELIAGVESRGFIFGTALAQKLGCGFVPIRKPGKLPAQTISREYKLEYGTNTIEMHADAIKPGQKVLMVDDLLATGGTMKAACELVEQLQGDIVGITFLIELSFLNGRKLLQHYNTHSILVYNHE